MANIKISDLTAAASAADANEFEINEAGTSKKVTGSQIKAYVNSADGALASKNTVATADIDNDAVTTAKILDGNVTTAKLAADAVDGTKIADDAIGNEHIAAGAVGTTELANASVTVGKISATGTASANTYLAGDGSWGAIAAGATLRSQIFTAPGTWTRPANTNRAKVTVIGGGGSINQPSYPGPGNPGGTSSFGSLASATGGGYSSVPNAPTVYGASGNGTVSSGTLIYGGAVDGEIPGPLRNTIGVHNGMMAINGVVGHLRGANFNATNYSVNGGMMAGVGASNGISAGFGGVAIGDVPVSNPQAITIGAAGNGPGPNRSVAGSSAGVVVVEWVE
jgi:hypothetical protein